MDIIYSAQEDAPHEGEELVILTVDRAALAKRRWRGVAQDSREFGFDLDHALADGSVFFREAGKCYVISQAPEPVLEIEPGPEPAGVWSELGSHLHSLTGRQGSGNSGFPLPTLHVLSPILLRIS